MTEAPAAPRWVGYDEECTILDMVTCTGATYPLLNRWARLGYLGEDRAPGRGHRRKWTGRDQRIADLIVRLGWAGITEVATAARLARDAVDLNVTQISPAEGITITMRKVS